MVYSPAKASAASTTPSCEKLENYTVRRKNNAARQSSTAVEGMDFETGLDGPANCAALAAAQLESDGKSASMCNASESSALRLGLYSPSKSLPFTLFLILHLNVTKMCAYRELR